VDCYIWYSDEGPGRAAVPPSLHIAIPNVPPHPSTARLPTSHYSLWHYNSLCTTYKVLTTAQPSYLHNLISLLPPRSTRSSSVVTLSRPPTILKITDRLFRYASPRLWNQLPDSFRQPHHSCLDSPPHPLLNSSLSSSPLSSSITPSLFHSWLKTYLFNKSFPQYISFYLFILDCLMITGLDRTYYAHHFIFSFTFYFFVCSVW